MSTWRKAHETSFGGRLSACRLGYPRAPAHLRRTPSPISNRRSPLDPSSADTYVEMGLLAGGGRDAWRRGWRYLDGPVGAGWNPSLHVISRLCRGVSSVRCRPVRTGGLATLEKYFRPLTLTMPTTPSIAGRRLRPAWAGEATAARTYPEKRMSYFRPRQGHAAPGTMLQGGESPSPLGGPS